MSFPNRVNLITIPVYVAAGQQANASHSSGSPSSTRDMNDVSANDIPESHNANARASMHAAARPPSQPEIFHSAFRQWTDIQCIMAWLRDIIIVKIPFYSDESRDESCAIFLKAVTANGPVARHVGCGHDLHPSCLLEHYHGSADSAVSCVFCHDNIDKSALNQFQPFYTVGSNVDFCLFGDVADAYENLYSSIRHTFDAVRQLAHEFLRLARQIYVDPHSSQFTTPTTTLSQGEAEAIMDFFNYVAGRFGIRYTANGTIFAHYRHTTTLCPGYSRQVNELGRFMHGHAHFIEHKRDFSLDCNCDMEI